MHSSDLADAASRQASSLGTAKTKHALEPKLRRLSELAGETAAALERVGDGSRDEQRRLAAKLRAAARQARQIGQGL